LAVVPSHENGLFLYLSHFIFYWLLSYHWKFAMQIEATCHRWVSVVRVIHARKHVCFRVRHLSTSAEHESHPWQTVFMHGGLICTKTILIGRWADTTSRVPNPSILYFLEWFVAVVFRIFNYYLCLC
jgi:hypothetical protein